MEKTTSILTNVHDLRRRAREHIENGAVTDGYRADRATILDLLNGALASEIVCVLRYKRHYFMAHGPSSKGIREEFLAHANEEQGHADQIAERITQLGGAPNLNPEGMLARSHSEYVPGDTILDMLKEDLVAERIAVQSYSELIRYVGDKDPTTRRLLEEILAKEEEHAEDLVSLMAQMAPPIARDTKVASGTTEPR